jgi:short-subunit dehydrogenase
MSLSRTIVILGAGPGLGQAIARRFATEGYAAALVARNQDRLDELAAQLPDATAFPADLADPAAVRAALAAVRERYGDPEVLVFNASMWVPGTATATPVDDMLAGLRVGVLPLLVAAQEVAPAMRAARTGTILATGSSIANVGSKNSAGLAMQKAAVRSLVRSLAAELAGDAVHVSTVTIYGTIAPGTAFDAGRIADTYWQLHRESPDSWRAEVPFER